LDLCIRIPRYISPDAGRIYFGRLPTVQSDDGVRATALEVRAEDNGKPAAGGEVRLEYLDMELVRAGGKPQLINAVQHNVPGAVTMMEVKLLLS
jgi:hypothetical protein